jgi:hypothetical protein
VGQRRPVLDDDDPPAVDRRSDERNVGPRNDDAGARVQLIDRAADRVDGTGFGGIDLVDDHDIGHPQVRLAGVKATLIARSQRVGDNEEEVWPVEREVVVATVPQDDVGLELGLMQDRPVVDTCVHDPPGVEMGLVLLALFDRRLEPIEIAVGSVALDTLGGEVAVRHGVADDDRCDAPIGEEGGNVSGRLALARPRSRRADRDDRTAAPEHRPIGAQEREVRPRRERSRRRVHHGLVAHVAVGEHHRIDVVVADDLLELLLGQDGNPGGVQRACQFRRISAIGNARNLGRGEGNDLDVRIVAVDDVEVVEVAPSGAHDRDSPAVHRGLLLKPARPCRRDTPHSRTQNGAGVVPTGSLAAVGRASSVGRKGGGRMA